MFFLTAYWRPLKWLSFIFVLFASTENGIIKTDKVYEVMLATDRSHFSRCNPYMDSPQSIGTAGWLIQCGIKNNLKE